MRDRSHWFSFALAFTAAVSMTAAVAVAQEPEAKAPPVKKAAPAATVPATTVPATTVPGTTVPGTTVPGTTVPDPEPPKADAMPKAVAVPAAGDKVEAGNVEAGNVEAGKIAATSPYARVLGKEVAVLCFASQRSPAYEDILREGDVVMVSKDSGEYVQVVLPLGVVGYVHKDFTTAPVDGVITTTRPRVSFRYRPKAGEAPTQLLEQGTPLRYLGTAEEEEGWWKVRMAPEAAWVGVKDVQVFVEPSPTLVKSYEALRKLHEEQCAQAAAEFGKADAAAKLRQAQAQKLEQLRKEAQAAAALSPAPRLQKLTALSNNLEDLQEEIPKDSDTAMTAELLVAQIKSQRLTAAAMVLLEEQPKPATDVAPLPRLAGTAPLNRFAVTGWLRFDKSATGYRRCRLEKGKKLIAYITCTSGRYDVDVFDGVEVGVTGPQTSLEQAIGLGLVIDAVRVEVLSVAPE